MNLGSGHPWNIVFLAGFLVYVCIRHVYATRVRGEKSTVRRIDALEKGLMTLVMLGSLLAPILYLFTPLLDFADYELPPYLPWIGVVTMVVALWLFRRSHVDLGRQWSVSLEVREGHRLITHGVYRSIRHPMYLSIWLLSLAQGLLLENWLAGWAAFVAFLPMHLIRTPREEAMMLETFGEDYRRFMDRSGRLFPRRAERLVGLVAGGVATAWVAYTLYAVARYGGAVVIDPETTARIIGVNNDGRVVSAVGLTYHGVTGAVMVVFELVAVGVALTAAHVARGVRRVAALLVVSAWAVLWFSNAVWLRGLGWDRSIDAAVLGFATFAAFTWLITATE